MILINNNIVSGATYNLVSGNFNEKVSNYWVAWGIGFYNFCKNILGLEVVKGPGTSYGAGGVAHGSNLSNRPYDYVGSSPTGSSVSYYYHSSIDFNWNSENGLDSLNETFSDFNTDGVSFLNFWKRKDGTNIENGDWLDENNIEWYNNDPKNGIDLTNQRFDYIIYFNNEDNNNKNIIGFRIKYPIVTITPDLENYVPIIAKSPITVPVLTTKEDLELNNSYNNFVNSKEWISVTNSNGSRKETITTLLNNSTEYSFWRKSTAKEASDILNHYNIWECIPISKDAFENNYSNFITNNINDNEYKLNSNLYASDVIKIYKSKNNKNVILKLYNSLDNKINFNLGYCNKNNNDSLFIINQEQYNFSNRKSGVTLYIDKNEKKYYINFAFDTAGNVVQNVENIINTNVSHNKYWSIIKMPIFNKYNNNEELYLVFNFKENIDNIKDKIIYFHKNNQSIPFQIFNIGVSDNLIPVAIPI